MRMIVIMETKNVASAAECAWFVDRDYNVRALALMLAVSQRCVERDLAASIRIIVLRRKNNYKQVPMRIEQSTGANSLKDVY